MTCKDCIHYAPCFSGGVSGWNNIEQTEDDHCPYFKNKADFVEIPCRCKDCDHFINYNPDRTYCEEHSDGWGDNIIYVGEDDYCSFGIRKKGGADNGNRD